MKDLTPIERDARLLMDMAPAAIKNAAEYSDVAAYLVKNKEFLKRIDAVFDPMIDAAKKSLASIKAERDKHSRPLEAFDKRLRALTADWMRREEERIEKAQAKAEAAAARKQAARDAKNSARLAAGKAPLSTVVLPPVVEGPDKAGLSYRKVYDYKVVEERSIPREYFILDEARIRAEIRAHKEETEIPGIAVIVTKVPVVR